MFEWFKKILMGVFIVIPSIVIGHQFAQYNPIDWQGLESVVPIDNPGLLAGFDSLNARFIGNWPFGASEVLTFDSVRNLVFLGSGGGVYILDVSEPHNPVKVSEGIHTKGYVRDLFYEPSNQRLYIAAHYGGLEIWDVANPTSPNSKAYVASYRALYILDVTDPSQPYLIGEFNSTPYGYLTHVQVSGDYAFLGGGYCFYTVNISDPASPFFVDSIRFSGSNIFVEDFHLQANYAYLTIYYSDSSVGFHVVDITNPENLLDIGQCETPTNIPMNVYVKNNFAFVVGQQTLENGGWFCVIDVSDPSLPLLIYTLGGYEQWMRGIYVSGDYAYLANYYHGLRIIDVSETQNPIEVGRYDTPSVILARAFSVSNNYAYLSYAWLDDGLHIIDISAPMSPFEVGYCSVPGVALSNYVSGDYAYVGGVAGTGLRIIDISNPIQPVEIGYYDSLNSWAVYVLEPYAYVGSDTGFAVIDISVPTNPYKISFTPTPSVATDIYTRGGYAYVLSNGFYIYDVSDPINPYEVYHYPIPNAIGLDISGNYAYFTNQDSLHIFDISDPTNPVKLRGYDTDLARDVCVLDNYCYYVADYRDMQPPDGLGGLRILDISDLSNIIEIGYYSPSANAMPKAVFASGDYVYVTDQMAGLQVYQNLLLSVEEKKGSANVSDFSFYYTGVNHGEAKFWFSLDKYSDISLNIYNAAGCLVETVATFLGSGPHCLSFRPNAAGVYFYRLKVNDTVKTGKLVIIK